MGKITEVRVHGVSGTPPAAILRTNPRIGAVRPVDASDPVPPPPVETLAKRTRHDRPVEVSFHPATDPATPGTDPHQPDVITAYNWSKLTSGRPRHALWLLLLPYTFMNTAGWMLPQRQHGPDASEGELSTATARSLDVLVRMASGLVSAIFVLFASAVTLDLVAAKCQPGADTCAGMRWLPRLDPGWWLIIGSLVSLLTLVVLGFWVGYDPRRRRQAGRAILRLRAAGGDIAEPEPAEPDPVATLQVTDTTLWHSRTLTRHLIRVHIGAAAVTLAWLLASIRWNTGSVADPGGSPIPWTLWVVVPATLVVVWAFVAASLVGHGTGSQYSRISLGAAFAGLVAYIVAALDSLSLSDRLWQTIRVEEGLAHISVWTTALLAMVGIVILAVGIISPSQSTAGSAAMVVLGGMVGGTFGAGVYTLAHRILISGREENTVMQDGGEVVVGEVVTPLGGMDWAALGFLVFLLATVIAALAIIALEPRELDPDAAATEALRNVTIKVRGLLDFAALVAFVGAAFFVVKELVDSDDVVVSPFFDAPQLTQDTILVLALMVLQLLAYVVYRLKGLRFALITTLVLAIVYLAVATDQLTQINLLGVVVRLNNVRELTVSLALLVPAAFITSRMISMVRDREQRRGIAILWDLGSFWQRWYHPFAAPTYAPIAVPDLAAYIRENATEDDNLVVAAHSQGTVIAMAALLTFDPQEPADQAVLRRLAFLSYGSPIDHLYARLFPAFFDHEAVEGLRQRLNGDTPRWINLWRQSDPIGGHIPQLGDASRRIPNGHDDTADGHSSYEKTDWYRDARADLIAAL